MDARHDTELADLSHSHRVFAERVKIFTERAVGGAFASLLGTFLLAWVQAPVAGLEPALAWLVCINAAELLVIVWGYQYRSAQPPDDATRPWAWKQIACTPLMGLAWGSSVWFFWVDGQILFYIVNLTVLIAVTALTLTIVSPFASATLLFTAGILAPVLAHLTVVDNPLVNQITAGLLILFLVQLRYAAIARRQLLDGLETAARNASLAENLRIGERQMAIAQQISGTGSWVYNPQTQRIWGSAEGLRLFGYPPNAGDFPLQDIEACIPEHGRVRNALQALIANGQDYDMQYMINPADGSPPRLVHSIARLENSKPGAPALVLGFIQDITKTKRAEAELVCARAEAEAANNAKSHFLAAVSHDLRQPLAALTLYVDMLSADALGANAKLLVRVKDCATNLDELLSGLLHVSKLETGAVVPVLSSIAMADVLAALRSVHTPQASQKGLRLRVRPSSLWVRTDRALLLRLLGNLVANAVQYTHNGGVLVACRRHAGKQWLEVYDTGVGIAEDKIDFIFGEFRQLPNEARNAGSGLGLYIVAKTAELLGLQIRVRSRVGRGSMFAIELPDTQAVVDDIRTPPHMTEKPLRVAVVEDNPKVLQALVLTLERLGHEVVAANCAEAVLSRLDGQAPDLLISDYRLDAGETGYDVIAAARANFGDALPAIIVTGETDQELVSSRPEQRIVVIYKPVQRDVLRMTMLQAMAQSEGTTMPQTG